MSMDLNREALQSKQVQDILNRKDIDVIVTAPAFANEVAAYLAYKANASYVQFITASFSMPNINFAVGDSYNPAYMPNPILGYTQQMSFLQRCANTALTTVYLVMRKFYILPQAEAILSEVYPN